MSEVHHLVSHSLSCRRRRQQSSLFGFLHAEAGPGVHQPTQSCWSLTTFTALISASLTFCSVSGYQTFTFSNHSGSKVSGFVLQEVLKGKKSLALAAIRADGRTFLGHTPALEKVQQRRPVAELRAATSGSLLRCHGNGRGTSTST